MSRTLRILISLLTAGLLAAAPVTATAAPTASARPAYGPIWCCG